MKHVLMALLLLGSSMNAKSQIWSFYKGVKLDNFSVNNFTLTGNIQTYPEEYYYNENGSLEVLLPPFHNTGFNSPLKTFPVFLNGIKQESATKGIRVYWGVYKISYHVSRSGNQNSADLTFSLNLLDKNWSIRSFDYSNEDSNFDCEFSLQPDGDGYEFDLYFRSKTKGGDIRIAHVSYKDENGVYKNFNVPVVTWFNQNINIWDVYQQTPVQTDFKIPVTLKNIIEGTTTQFGDLKLNSQTITTGNYGYFRPATNEQLENGTLEYQTAKRNYSFKWSLSDVTTTNSIYAGLVQSSITRTGVNPKNATRIFKPVFPLTIKTNLEGIGLVAGSVLFKDPVTNSINGFAPNSFVSQAVSGTGYVKNEAFENFNEEVDGVPSQKYSLQAVPQFTYSNTDWYWLSGDFNSTAPTEFLVSAATTKEAVYKGHLRTGLPNNSDAKNQRRTLVITESGNQQGQQVMVYESMGHVWVTASSDGINWCKEERLSGSNGGKNPSLSNVISSGNINPGRYSVLVTWLEGNDIQMQSLTPINGTIYWGWGLQSIRSSSNLVSLSALENTSANARLDSRPVALLENSGSNIKITIASEAEDNGIQTHTFTVLFQGTGVSSDIGIGTSSVDLSYISSSTGDQYPVFISTPAVYGYAAKKAVYYLGTGYASGKRIVEYNMATAVKTVLPTAYGDYTYNYLQSAVSEANATAVLVAGAQVNDANGTHYNVNLYGKATYTTGAPSLSTTYTNYTQANVSVQQNSGFGSGTPTNQIYMKSTSSGSWYKANGASTIGTNISGFLMPEKFIQLSNLNSVVNRTSIGGVVATPSVLERYQNSSGTQLNKTASSLAINVRGFRFFTPINESEQMTILDFSGSKVEIIDSLESGKLLVAVKVLESSDNGVIVSQNDSLKVPMSVDVVRNGNSIRSYSASEWDVLTSQSIGGLESGDVLLFRLPFNVTSSWGYEEVDFEETSLAKGSMDEKEGSELKALDFSITAYPNPFNPQTTFKITLPELKNVTLEVYNMLGQKVQTLTNGKLEAGEHNFQFNGTNLATGTYIYRLVAGEKIQSGKILLMK